MVSSIEQRLANELAVSVHQVQAAIALRDDGATVPFIARYRKEATGGLDDISCACCRSVSYISVNSNSVVQLLLTRLKVRGK